MTRISKANDAVQAEIGGAEPGSYYSGPAYGTENSFITTPSDKTAIPIHCDDIPELKKFHGRNFAGAYYTINEASSRTSYRIIYKIIDNAVADDEDEDF